MNSVIETEVISDIIDYLDSANLNNIILFDNLDLVSPDDIITIILE